MSKEKAVKKVAKKVVTTNEGENNEPKLKAKKPANEIVLKTIDGKDVDALNYFYKPEDQELAVPTFFNRVCGKPVDREDLIEIFNKIFKPEDEFLFYKKQDREIYIVIPPIKFADIGSEYGSENGDYQKHAISFINEGSVNLDTMKRKLQMVAKSVNYSNR